MVLYVKTMIFERAAGLEGSFLQTPGLMFGTVHEGCGVNDTRGTRVLARKNAHGVSAQLSVPGNAPVETVASSVGPAFSCTSPV